MQKKERDTGWRVSQPGYARIGALALKTTRRRIHAAGCRLLSIAFLTCAISSPVAAQTSTPPDVAEAARAASSSTVQLRSALKMNTQNLDPQVTHDRFIIKYRSGTVEGRSPTAVQSKLDRLGSAFPAKARHSRRLGAGADVVTTARKLNAREARAFMRAIASDLDVEYVEPDREMSIQLVPNDPEYARQWAPKSDPNSKSIGVRAEGAWDLANGHGVVMALVDMGVTRHSDLTPNVLPGYGFMGDNSGGDGTEPGIITGDNCTSVIWHGTHVAGIMGAMTNNGNGIAGIAPGARIVPVRAMNACGRGSMSDVAEGIVWAAGGSVPGAPVNPYPAKIINVSVSGGGTCDRTLQSAIDDATSRGAIIVAAAGNDNRDVSSSTPANCRNVISVAGTSLGGRYNQSNYGEMIDIAAPGQDIWSTYNSGTKQPVAESYSFMSGTSMAAPHVTGVAALVQSIAPKALTVAEMRNLLQLTVQPFATGQPDQYIGPGILDANAAVVAARAGTLPVAADFNCSQSQDSMQVTCTDLSTARGGVPIKTWAWNLGTGAADTVSTKSVSPVWNYDLPGVYKTSLTVTDSNGVVSKYTRPFEVKAPAVTDLTNDYNPVRFPMTPGQTLYFMVTIPAGPHSMMMVAPDGTPNRVGWKDLTFTLTPDGASDAATLSVRSDSINMANPDCTASMAQRAPAKCTIPLPGSGGNFYAMVKASTAINASIVFAATHWQTPDVLTNGY
ncbi:S8 family serine peptidase [Paraburkholderia sediminicola]